MDDGFFSAFYDIKMGDKKLDYQKQLIDLFASRTMIPAGQPLSFSTISNGVKDGSSVTVDGAPLQLMLKVPFFNHSKQVALIANVEIDNADAPGTKVAGNLLARGKHSINQMIVDLALLAEISGGYAQSPSALRIAADQAELSKLLEDGFSCSRSGTVECYKLSQEAIPAAKVVSQVYAEALALAAGR